MKNTIFTCYPLDEAEKAQLLQQYRDTLEPAALPDEFRRLRAEFAALKAEHEVLKADYGTLKANYESRLQLLTEHQTDSAVQSSAAVMQHSAVTSGGLTGKEALLVKSAELAVEFGAISVSFLQRRLKLSYATAARIVDELECCGIVGPFEGAKPRRVLVSPQELTEWKSRLAAMGGKIEISE